MSAKKLVETTTITIEVPVILRSYLLDLLRTGLYGNSLEDVGHTLIAAEVRRLVLDAGKLQRRYSA